MSVSHISYSDLLNLWERSKTLMDIAAMETGNPQYRAIFNDLESSIKNMSSIIESEGDLQLAVEKDGMVEGKLTTYHFDLTEEEISNIKNFGWSNTD